MRSKQKGFTLIELVVVIVILGILAATALPKFINLSTEANTAAVQGVAGAVSGASAVNYAARKAAPGKGVPIADCATATISTLLQGGLPTGYTSSGPAIAADTTESCSITNGSATATAQVTGI